jgi:hypothetical protein
MTHILRGLLRLDDFRLDAIVFTHTGRKLGGEQHQAVGRHACTRM